MSVSHHETAHAHPELGHRESATTALIVRVLDAEGISMSGTVLSLIGAAFPEGTPEPKLAFVLPPQ